MKNLNNALQKGNLTPKERVLLLVHNAVKGETTGKGILNEAEKHAVSDGWQPTNNEQIKEYNRYNKGWRTAGFAELDAQTTFLETQSFYNQEKVATSHLLLYPFFRNAKDSFERLDTILPVDINQALEIVEKQKQVKLEDGIVFDYAVYQLAYETLDKPLQEDLKALYEEVAYDHQYLDQEEYLADLLKDKDTLTKADKEKLADKLVKGGYNSFAKEWQFWHYYASIPLKEIAKRWMDKREVTPTPLDESDNETLEKAREKVQEVRKAVITPEEALKEYTAENLRESIEDYAKTHNTTVEDELKAVVMEWLDEGLLDEYTPIFMSTSTQTHIGETKLPHKEVFKAWMEAKAKAKATLEGLIKVGGLARDGDTITGESLYSFTGDDHEFIKDFKKRVDHYDANLGIVYADDDPEHKGRHLDRELLICDIDEAGKVRPFSMFEMTKDTLQGYFDVMGFVTEREEKGERVIEFKHEAYNELVKNTAELIRNNYAILLAFREIFTRLSKTYRIDLAYKINRWIGEVEGFIDSHNEALQSATKKGLYERDSKKSVRIKDDLYIDKKKIQAQPPSHERVVGYFKEFEETLGSDF
jgi:post-segregation antitoxin (ccd killing protein)